MTTSTGSPGAVEGQPSESTARPRDSADTRRRLLQAARRRFARDGYASTTVRDIASEAGVNVALINRYFTSKEGLFEACLRRTVEDLNGSTDQDVSVDQVVEAMLEQLGGLPQQEHSIHLLLLLRSSGDDRADEIRRDTLRSYAEGIAAAAGWRSGDVGGETLLLGAQIALCTTLGIVLLRSSTGLEPLSSATVQELRTPLAEVLSTLLSPSGRPRATEPGAPSDPARGRAGQAGPAATLPGG